MSDAGTTHEDTDIDTEPTSEPTDATPIPTAPTAEDATAAPTAQDAAAASGPDEGTAADGTVRAGSGDTDGTDGPVRPLRAGERILLIDSKQRRYLVTLAEGGEFHSHAGFVPHDDIIGTDEGSTALSTRRARYRVVRPTLADFILKMPRGAQVIYPKDLGPILMLADIFPGARVLESGIGSGALSMTLLRAGAHITGYELREDFANRAQRNVEDFLGPEASARYAVEQRDCYEGIDGSAYDRVVLDLPEPWNVVKHAERALRPGGILVAYTPSITQVSQLREALEGSRFRMAETLEVLNRGWYVEGQAVRPDHRMVAHTAFLTAARLFQD